MKVFSATRFKKPEWAFALIVAVAAAVLLHNWAASDVGGSPSMEECLRNGDAKAFEDMGNKGIRFLTDALAHTVLPERHWTLFKKLPPRLQEAIGEHYGAEPFDRRQQAALILLGLGSKALPAMPTVLKVLQEPMPNDVLKYACAEILGAIGPEAKPAIPVLLAAVTNNDYAAQAAAMALWRIARQTNVLVDCISNRLHSSGPARAYVLTDFERVSDGLKCAEPVIEQALYDQDEQVRHQAEGILSRIDPIHLSSIINAVNENASSLVASHIQALQSLRRGERCNALKAISVLGPSAYNAVPSLVSTLEACESQLRTSGGMTFGRVRFEGDLCLEALAEIGTAATLATPTLVLLIKPPSNKDDYPPQLADGAHVCRTLGQIGPDAAEAIPFLRQILTNSLALPSNRRDRHHLSMRRNTIQQVFPLKISDPLGGVTVAAALIRIAPNDSVARAALQTLRTNESDMVGITASLALWKVGVETNLPLDILRDVVQTNPEPRGSFFRGAYRYQRFHSDLTAEPAIQMLGDIGPAARSALPELEQHLDPKDELRRAAAIAIRKIDPEEAKRLGLPGLLIVCPQ